MLISALSKLPASLSELEFDGLHDADLTASCIHPPLRDAGEQDRGKGMGVVQGNRRQIAFLQRRCHPDARFRTP